MGEEKKKFMGLDMSPDDFMKHMTDNQVAQSWMDKSFFEMVMKQYLKDDKVEVASFEISPGAKPGENFASTLYRAKIVYSTKNSSEESISVIIKTIPESGNFKTQFITTSILFDIEMKMYGELFPQYQEIWKSANDTAMTIPKLIYQSKSPKYVIVLEDISVNGYNTIAYPSENFEESKMIAERLAKFHAAGFYLNNEKNYDFSNFNVNLLSIMPREMIDQSFTESIVYLIEEVKTWPGFEKYVPKLQNFVDNLFENVSKCYAAGGSYNVLNHSDHHIKNSMYKMVDGKMEDICFIDHQLEVFATPVIDLCYSLYFDLTPENRAKYRDEYIMHYHNEFVKALKSYGYLKKIPTLLDLQMEFLKFGAFEVWMSTVMSGFLFIDWAAIKPEDFDMGEGTKRFKKKCASDPRYVDVMKRELPRFFYKGII